MTMPDPRFAVMMSDVDGHPLIANVNLALSEDLGRNETPWFLSICTKFETHNEAGLPTNEESLELDAWETAIEPEISSLQQTKFVGRVSWNGNRELIYYLSEPARAAGRLQEIIDNRQARPFAFSCEKDEKWEKVRIYFGDKSVGSRLKRIWLKLQK